MYGVSIISGPVVAICTAVVAARCNSRCQYYLVFGVRVQNFTQLGGCADFYVLLFGVVYFMQVSEKVQRRTWQWLDERSGKKAWAAHRKFKFAETEKDETGEKQSQEHAHNFLWHQGDWSQIIRSNSQFRILLWSFTAIAWKYAETSPRTLATKELAVASRQRTVSQYPFTMEFFAKTAWL
jgi:hypothetical protein